MTDDELAWCDFGPDVEPAGNRPWPTPRHAAEAPGVFVLLVDYALILTSGVLVGLSLFVGLDQLIQW